MLDLLTPTDHAGAYEWASVYLAHLAIGLVLTALVAAVIEAAQGDWIDLGDTAPVVVTLVYFVAWEGMAQRYGAGMPDALIDTLAVGCGGLAGLFLWRRSGKRVAMVLALAAAVLWRGVRARK